MLSGSNEFLTALDWTGFLMGMLAGGRDLKPLRRYMYLCSGPLALNAKGGGAGDGGADNSCGEGSW